MILKGSQRGGAIQLAKHLMNAHDNDHIEVHSIDGFIADEINGALEEVYAISQATKCNQFMFSLSLSPPKNAVVPIEDFETAIDQAAEKLGLAGQPRIILFHEKEGRRHCHAVFSRIDTAEMKAINLPFYKDRLYNLSRELFLTHGWDMPRGLQDKSLSDPLNYTLEEYQVAKRANRDPREIKAVLIECWQQSDSKQAFAAALQDKGFYLCRGDRRGYVALDWLGNVYSLSRWTNEKTRILKQRLGDPDQLPSIEEGKAQIAMGMTEKHREFVQEIDAEFENRMTPLKRQKERIIKQQRQERQTLKDDHKNELDQATQERNQRLRKGLLGLWDWVSGRKKHILQKNATENEVQLNQQRRTMICLIEKQRNQRNLLHRNEQKLRQWHEILCFELAQEFERWQVDQKRHHEGLRPAIDIDFEPTLH